MTIPNSKTIMPALLDYLKDGNEHSIKEIENQLILHFNLTQEEKNQLKPSGHETLFHNRIHWAKFSLKKIGLLHDPRKSFVKITPRGLEVLNQKPKKRNLRTK